MARAITIMELAATIAIGIFPSFVWLFFYLKEDPHPEPFRWIVITFIAGMTMVPVAYFVERFLATRVASFIGVSTTSTTFQSLAFMFLGVALVEELVKFLAVRAVLTRNTVLDEPVDAMIYMITAALGFAALENIVLLGSFDGSALIGRGLPTAMLRMIGANFLHTLASGLFGFAWALSFLAPNRVRQATLVWGGLVSATVLHGIFNLFIMKLGSAYIFPVTLFLFVVGLIVLHDFDILKTLWDQDESQTKIT